MHSIKRIAALTALGIVSIIASLAFMGLLNWLEVNG